jgi:hypothetical protein
MGFRGTVDTVASLQVDDAAWHPTRNSSFYGVVTKHALVMISNNWGWM